MPWGCTSTEPPGSPGLWRPDTSPTPPPLARVPWHTPLDAGHPRPRGQGLEERAAGGKDEARLALGYSRLALGLRGSLKPDAERD